MGNKRADETESALPPLTASVTAALSRTVSDAVREACAAVAGRAPSPETQKLLLARVSAKTASEHKTLDNYWVIVEHETDNLLDRILAYQYVTQYRKPINAVSAEFSAAWQIHSQSLRVGEIYIVQDRTSALLRFLTSVGRDVGMSVADQKAAFEKGFKKLFGRRLRERHRLVHGHERPSLESLIISFGSPTASFPRELLMKEYVDIVAKFLPLIQSKASAGDGETPTDIAAIERLHEGAAVMEARQMLDLVGKALLGTIGHLPPKGGGANEAT